MSALIILPFNALLVWVFRNIEAKPSAESIRFLKEKSKIWWFYELFFCCFKNRQTDFSFLRMISRVTKEYYTTNDENGEMTEHDDVSIATVRTLSRDQIFKPLLLHVKK